MTAQAPTRRLAAILSADVVGYTLLMRADETTTIATLKRCHELMQSLIERHGGRVVNTAGDGLLAEFASAVNAVECAMAVQRALAEQNTNLPNDRKMQLRIGVNLGDLIVEHDHIYGDGVNVAARVQTLAEPGGICVSGMVYDQIQHVLDLGYDSLGKQKVKNVAQPIPVYRIAVGSEMTRRRRWWPRFRDKRLALAGGLAALLLIVVLVWIVGARTGLDSPPGPGQLSIAVPPFANLNRDVGQPSTPAAASTAAESEVREPNLQYQLGLQYAEGQGVAKDLAQAFQWVKRAAEQNHADAQFYLGWMYSEGHGTAKDPEAAARWSRRAAEQGQADAQHFLGWLLMQGTGVPKNEKEAVQ